MVFKKRFAKKSFASTKKVFKVVDKVDGETVCLLQAVNEKDFMRILVFSGLFKVNRLEDLKFIEVEEPKELLEIDPKKILKELSIELEDKAEKIGENPNEVKQKIQEEIKKEE